MKNRRMNERGFSLIELMIVMIISAIAMISIAPAFMTERSFWAQGNRQAAAQRDAEMALRAIARVARQSNNYVINANQITFTTPAGCTRQFQTAGAANDQLQLVDNCIAPSETVTLIDGVRSDVTQFMTTSITTRLVQIQLRVTRENREHAQMQTQIFLCNAT